MSKTYPVRQCRECHEWFGLREFTWRGRHDRRSNWCSQCIGDERTRGEETLAARREVITDLARELGDAARVSTVDPPKRVRGTSRPRLEPSRLFVELLINVLDELTLEEVAFAFTAIGNPLTRERVRQIQNDALAANGWRRIRGEA